MRLTAEEHGVAVERYAHVKPARGWKAETCGRMLRGVRRSCTRETGHRGPHVAHGRFGRPLAVWDEGAAPTKARGGVPRSARGESAGRKPVPGKPLGLREPRSQGLLRTTWDHLTRIFSSVEDLALLVMFLAFVFFAIDWLLLILR